MKKVFLIHKSAISSAGVSPFFLFFLKGLYNDVVLLVSDKNKINSIVTSSTRRHQCCLRWHISELRAALHRSICALCLPFLLGFPAWQQRFASLQKVRTWFVVLAYESGRHTILTLLVGVENVSGRNFSVGQCLGLRETTLDTIRKVIESLQHIALVDKLLVLKKNLSFWRLA